jgi:TetR/AcrR family transcriptional regulator
MHKAKTRHGGARTRKTPGRKSGVSPRKQLTQARAEETRARILQAARNVFAEHGLDGISVRDIALAANTTHSMITYHFGSKEQLWREAVRDMFAFLERTVIEEGERAGEHKLPVQERFKQMIRRYVRYCAAHPEHARITFAETIRGGERLEWMVREFVQRNHRNILPVFEQLMAEGLVPPMPAASFLYALVGMTQLPFVLAKEAALTLNYDMMSEQAIERHAEAVIALVLPHGKIAHAGKTKASRA